MQSMNYKEAADFLKIAEGTLRNKVSTGSIKCHKVGGRVLFFREELEAWVTGPAPVPAADITPPPPRPVAFPATAADKAPPSDVWNGVFELSFSGKGEKPAATLETLPGANVRMTPDDMRELARYLVDAAARCEAPAFRGVKRFRILRESPKNLSGVVLVPHDTMKDLRALAGAAIRTADPTAATPDKYAVRFITDGLRAQQPVINRRLRERNLRQVTFASIG